MHNFLKLLAVNIVENLFPYLIDRFSDFALVGEPWRRAVEKAVAGVWGHSCQRG